MIRPSVNPIRSRAHAWCVCVCVCFFSSMLSFGVHGEMNTLTTPVA